MKKLIAFTLTLCTIFCLMACSHRPVDTAGDLTNPTGVTAPTSEPTTAEWTYISPTYEPFQNYGSINRFGIPETADVSLDIPVYAESALFDRASVGKSFFELGQHCGFYMFAESSNYVPKLFEIFPTNAVRVRTDGSAYAVYDTDTGYRLYIFIWSTVPITEGFPVLIKKNSILSYKDFEDIQIGDPIEKVEAIDSVATKHKQIIQRPAPGAVANRTKWGYPPCSVHYLTDGILIIEYTMTAEKDILISEIIYDTDYLIADNYDRMINHKIKDIDLPIS